MNPNTKKIKAFVSEEEFCTCAAPTSIKLGSNLNSYIFLYNKTQRGRLLTQLWCPLAEDTGNRMFEMGWLFHEHQGSLRDLTAKTNI